MDSAACITRAQKRYAISEVAADWHEIIVSHCVMRPSNAHALMDNCKRGLAGRHTTVLISHTNPIGNTVRISRFAEGRRLSVKMLLQSPIIFNSILVIHVAG